jgi:hypothetical protein
MLRMESPNKPVYQKFIQMLETFVTGEHTSHEFVREMDEEFWTCGLNEDDRFSDLLTALDMFGVPAKDFGCDEKTLASECRYALRLLKEQSRP